MRCFYHAEADAVAICKSCGHALCHDCHVEVATVAACRDRCESNVGALNDLIQRNRTIYQKTGVAYRWFSVFFLALGLFFMLGAIGSLGTDEPDLGGFVTTALFIMMGIGMWVFSRRIRAK